MKYSLVLFTLLLSSWAWCAPASFTFEGILSDSANAPLTTTQYLKVDITDPAGSCVLYSKGYQVDPSSDGAFAIIIDGSGGVGWASNIVGNFNEIFTAGNKGTCYSGGTYTAVSADTRKMALSLCTSNAYTTCTPFSSPFDITSVPFATQSSIADLALSFMPSTFLDMQSNQIKNLAGPSLATDAATMGYVDSEISGLGTIINSVTAGTGITLGGSATAPSVGLSTTAVTANTYGSATEVPVFTVDAYGRITGVTNTTITVAGGITSLNGLTNATQTFTVGSTGTDFNIVSNTSTHTFHIPNASATNRGALTSADWSTFNNKQAALGFTPLDPGNNLSELTASAGTVRTNLGLGGAAVLNVGTAAGTVASGNDSRIVGAIQNAGNSISFQQGPDASKGAFGTAGRYYVAADSQKIYYDDGTAWIIVGSGAGGSVTWASVDKTTSSLADLTTKSAAALDSGTLNDLRLSTNVPLKNAANIFSSGDQQINNSAAGQVGLTIKGVAGQAADLMKIKDSAGADLYTFNQSGNMSVNTDVTDKFYVDSVGAGKISDTGDSMTGDLNMLGGIQLKFQAAGGGPNFAGIMAPNALTPYVLTLPVDDGTANQVLTTDGAGILSWTTPAGGLSGTTAGTYTNLGSGVGGGYTGNTVIGNSAASTAGSSAQFNTIMGYQSASALTSGQFNTLLGYQAGASPLATGIGNTLVGANSGVSIGSVSKAVALGQSASVTGTGGVAIGAGASAPANTVVIGSHNGTAFQERMRIDSAGNVGIGVTNPVMNLDINGGLKLGNPAVVCDVTTKGSMRFNPGLNAGVGDVEICVGDGAGVPYSWGGPGGGGGAGVMDLSSSQTVLTGAMKTFVDGITVGTGGTLLSYNTGALVISNGVNVAAGPSTFAGDTNFDAGTLKIDSTNNRVGIAMGAGAPSVALHVGEFAGSSADIAQFNGVVTIRNNSAGSPTNLILTNLNGTNTGSAIELRGNSAGTPLNAARIMASQANGEGRLSFATATTNILNDRMTILPNGNIGIGFTSPSTILDVNGAITLRPIAEPVGANGQGKIWFDSTSNKLKAIQNTGMAVDLLPFVSKGNGSTSFSPSLPASMSLGTTYTGTISVGMADVAQGDICSSSPQGTPSYSGTAVLIWSCYSNTGSVTLNVACMGGTGSCTLPGAWNFVITK